MKDPVIDGATMEYPFAGIFSNNNTFRIYRHNNSVNEQAILTIDRGNGQIRIYGKLVEFSVSDRRVKENVDELAGSLARLCQLRPVNYDYKETYKNDRGRKRTGFIAQELKEVFPDMVYIGPNSVR